MQLPGRACIIFYNYFNHCHFHAHFLLLAEPCNFFLLIANYLRCPLFIFSFFINDFTYHRFPNLGSIPFCVPTLSDYFLNGKYGSVVMGSCPFNPRTPKWKETNQSIFPLHVTKQETNHMIKEHPKVLKMCGTPITGIEVHN